MRWLSRGEATIPLGFDWLSEVERRRATGMRYTKRRTEYLLRRYAGKCAVAAAIGLPDDPGALGRIAVLNAPTGAPFVQVDGERLGMDVSLTDRAGWAVCLVGSDLGAVGCDLEIVEPRSEGFVADFLTAPEQALVHAATALGPDARDAAANLVWSAKESALKVLRTGLRADTRTVQVALPELAPLATAAPAPTAGATGTAGWHPLTVTTRLGVLPGWWRRDGVFLLTVVAASADALGEPPAELPGSADLAAADPIHSWLVQPIAEPPPAPSA
ncbi:MAG: 4'-phosphopantetheinyl transferase superfamily protein [Candidatus Nanopelagicales bacterium]|jgi:4'-phosphopantetheinyl transferase|nr:4'-phosphopantetheinyl transferase superfamily protein [Candidatus Nanopelagicales bacterium]